MKAKRSLALLLAVWILLLSSCGNNNAETQPDTSGNPASDATESESQTEVETKEFDYRQSVEDNIGEYDFQDAEFRVCYSSEQMQQPYFADEMTGATVNDAVYYRTDAIESRFKVKLTQHDTGGNWNEVAEAVRVATKAQTGEHDLALAHTFIGLTGLMTSGYVYDWNQVPVINTSAEWWNQNISETLTIGNALYVQANDYIYQRPVVLYFNKQMIEDLHLDNPYELVKNGTWTWDRLREMGMAAAEDLDGNGIYDENDRYGLGNVLGWQTISVIQSCGMMITSQNDDGTFSFRNYEDEKMYSIFEKFYDICYNSNNMFYSIVYTPDQGALNGYNPIFNDGRMLFLYSNTELLPLLNDLEMGFGLLPLPKYDEKQEGYYSMADTQMLVIPADAKDINMVGVISEALAVESYKKVVPAVYETMFANRYLRDSESYDMFNITRAGLVYEAIWTLGEGNDLVYAMPYMMMAKNVDLASYYNTRKKSAETTINRVVKKILERQAEAE